MLKVDFSLFSSVSEDIKSCLFTFNHLNYVKKFKPWEGVMMTQWYSGQFQNPEIRVQILDVIVLCNCHICLQLHIKNNHGYVILLWIICRQQILINWMKMPWLLQRMEKPQHLTGNELPVDCREGTSNNVIFFMLDHSSGISFIYFVHHYYSALGNRQQ